MKILGKVLDYIITYGICFGVMAGIGCGVDLLSKDLVAFITLLVTSFIWATVCVKTEHRKNVEGKD